MQLKDPFQQNVVYTYVSLLFPVLSQHQQSHCCDVKWHKIVKRATKKELGDWHENRSKDSQNEVRSKIDEYGREEQRLAKQSKRMAILRNDHTSLTSSNSFNVRFAILLTLCR